MTATLAEHLDTANAHLGRVRDEYHRTKADHAHTDGCSSCTVAFVEGRSSGWDYLPDGTPAFCPPCAAERNRLSAQQAPKKTVPLTAAKPKDRCVAGHKMDEANTYVYLSSDGRVKNRCRECGRRRNREARAKDKAASA